MLQCYRCKRKRPEEEFPPGEKRCIECKEYCHTYYQTHRQQEIDRAKEYQNRDRNRTNKYKRELNRISPLNIILQQARTRAKRKGIPFNLKIEDLEFPEKCPILGLPLTVNAGHAQANSISLDRIIPELGYIKGNVAIISYKANTIKNNATVEELEKVLNWYKSKL